MHGIENSLSPYKNLFFISQERVRFAADLGTKGPSQKCPENKLKFLEDNSYEQKFLKTHPSKWGDFLDGCSVLPKLDRDHLMALEINSSFYPNVAQSALPEHIDTGIKFLNNKNVPTTQCTKGQCNEQCNTLQCNMTQHRQDTYSYTEGEAAAAVQRLRHEINLLPPAEKIQTFEVRYTNTNTDTNTNTNVNRTFFESLLQRKFSFLTGKRGPLSIIGLLFTFIDKCKAKIEQRKSGKHIPLISTLPQTLRKLPFCKKYKCQNVADTVQWYKCKYEEVHCNGIYEVAPSCAIQDCNLPCQGSLKTLFRDAVHPLLYLSLAPPQNQKDFSLFLQYLRKTMGQMIHHGFTESYEVYSRVTALLILSILYSEKPTCNKQAVFTASYNTIDFFVLEGSIIKEPLPLDINALFTQAKLINIGHGSILAEILLFDAHMKCKHFMGLFSETILVALSNCFIENLKKKLNALICATCNKRKAATAHKRAALAPAPSAAADWITTMKKFDNECVIDYLIINTLQGLRYILMVVFKNSLMTRFRIMEDYSSRSLLFSLIQLYYDYGATTFHADHGSQIVALATHLSQLSDEHRLQLLGNSNESHKIHSSHLGRFFQRRTSNLPLPKLNVKVYLAKSHHSLGIVRQE